MPIRTAKTYFYPRSPCGERPLSAWTASAQSDFYPRSPCGERHTGQPVRGLPSYFYPRSPCGERLPPQAFPFAACVISIHALLAESDLRTSSRPLFPLGFLSTLSLRRATTWTTRIFAWVQFLSTLSLRRATPGPPPTCRRLSFLSTLSLRRATNNRRAKTCKKKFLSTLSLRRATLPPCGIPDREGISIHALLAESDVYL